MRHRRANIAIDGSGTGNDNLACPVASHGFQDVVRGNGFLFEIQPRVINAPAGIRVGGQVKNPVNVPKVRRNLFQVQKINNFQAQSPVLCMPRDMLPSSRGKIIQHPDFLGCGIVQKRIQQMGTDKSRPPVTRYFCEQLRVIIRKKYGLAEPVSMILFPRKMSAGL